MRALLIGLVFATGCATTKDSKKSEPVVQKPTEDENSGPLVDPGHVASSPLPVEAASTAPVTPPTATPIPAKDKHSSGTIARAELNAVLDAAPGRFLQHVDTEPRLVGGHFRGWKLASFFPGDPRFAEVDLQAGDVVVSVNGQPIERPDQLMQVWQSLRTEHSLVVVLERDGMPRQLRYDIAD